MNKLIEIINNKLESARNHLMRLSNDDAYQRDTIMMEHLRGEIDAYNDVLATIRGMKDVTIPCEQVIEVLEALANDCEKNNNTDGAYYYRSSIPYFKSYIENKSDS